MSFPPFMPSDTLLSVDDPRWAIPDAPSTGRRASAARLADAARRVIDRISTVELDEDELTEAAARVEEVATRLDSTGRPRTFWGFHEAANAGDIHAFFDRSPIIGTANPLAAPVRMEVDGGRVRGTATFGAAYEGPPGCLHGGLIA